MIYIISLNAGISVLNICIILLIFNVALPRLIASVATKFKFDETRFYEYITKNGGFYEKRNLKALYLLV